jgi:uncharacterized membrane protein
MFTDRPRIKVPFESIDIIIELISITLILLMFIYAGMEYANLPDSIASHFNANGKADDYSNKITIWLLPTISLLTYIGLFIANKYPHIHNYVVNITEENALKNYRFSTRTIRYVNLYCVLVFAFLTYKIIEGAKGNELDILGMPFLIFTLGTPLIGVALIIFFQRKINK